MALSEAAGSEDQDRAAFGQLLVQLRPKLHPYCARMTGSAIDGEDVVQDAIAKAIEALPRTAPVANPESWLFRIAHNAALDFLRRRSRQNAVHSDEDPDVVPDPMSMHEDRQTAATNLRAFMRLSAGQRSSVILMDVLGYSLDEIAGVTGATIPAVKAALHRGRLRLRAIAGEPDDQPPPALAEPERSLLAGYVDRFNARDFDAIRDMLADEVRLELVARTRLNGGARSAPTSTTTLPSAIGISFPASSTADRRSLSGTLASHPAGRPTSLSWIGRVGNWSVLGIFDTHGTQPNPRR